MVVEKRSILDKPVVLGQKRHQSRRNPDGIRGSMNGHRPPLGRGRKEVHHYLHRTKTSGAISPNGNSPDRVDTEVLMVSLGCRVGLHLVVAMVSRIPASRR